MPSDQSWNLKPELREAASEAARERGLSLEDYLQTLILESATGEKMPSRPARTRRREPAARPEPASPDIQDGMQAISSRLETLTRQLDSISANRRAPLAPAPADDNDISTLLRRIDTRIGALGSSVPPQPLATSLDNTLSRLDRRLETIEYEGRKNSSDLERRISAVDDALASLNREPVAPAQSQPIAADPTPRSNPISEPDFGLDAAIAEIAERQRLLDTSDTPNPLQEQFSALSLRLGAAGPLRQPQAEPPLPELHDQLHALTVELQSLRQPDGLEQMVRGLREELADIGRQLGEAAPRQALQALESEVSALTARVDHGRERGGDATAFASIERGLESLHHALQNFAPAETLTAFRDEVHALDHKIETIAANAADAEASANALRQLERAIGELREIASHAASGEALIELAEEVQQIGDKVDRLIAAPPPATAEFSSLLEQRFNELAEHLNARSEAAAAVPYQLTNIVEGLADKLDRVELGASNAPLLDAIAKQITRLTDHVETTDARFDTFEQVERSMRELLDGMHQVRESAVSAAERAAKEISLDVLRQSAHVPVEIDSLRQDFDLLRQSHSQSDRRTQDTLEAVHDTLERLVDRLATVETDIRGEPTGPIVESPSIRPMESLAAATAPMPSPASRTSPAAADSMRRAHAAATEELVAPAIPPQERRPIDPTLPADHPLEPGSATRNRPVSAAERIAASEAALGPAKPVAESDAKLNFIAAARRAAQAASNMAPPAESGAERQPKATSSFGALAQRLTGRRPLLLGLLLLVGAGALHLMINGIGSREAPRTEATRKPIVTAAAPATVARPAVSVPTTTITAQAPAPLVPPVSPSAMIPPVASTAGITPAPAQETPPPARIESRMTPTVSPLTIASIAIPAGDATGSLGRATGLMRAPAIQPAAMPSASTPAEPPAALGKGLRAAALAGNPAAEYELAVRYAEGRGTAVNFEEAARWFERAANRDLAPAQYRLGSLYEKGQGVKKDLDQARRLYRAAADKGNAKAMHNLAVLYAEGIDGKPEFKSAAEWFRLAATRGVADSQYNLGILCARGLGAEQNLAESYKWFALAAQQGDQDAGKKRDDVAARLDQPTLAAAQKAVQTFAPEPQPEEAVGVKTPPGGWETATSPTPPAKPKSGIRSRKTQQS
jgi:localization factor PodJL